jgi:hypothetical protein
LTLVVVVVLVVLWAIVLLPPLLRSHSERSHDSIGMFNHRLDVLGRTNGTLVSTASTRAISRERAAKRRRDVSRVLILAFGGSGLIALGTNATLAWALFVVSTLALGAFLGLWAYGRSLRADRALKVRPIPQPRPAAPELALRRAVSS